MQQPFRRTPSLGAAARALVIATCAALGIAAAQPAPVGVSDVLPATTVAAFYAAPTSAGWGAIASVLESLDLDAAGATLARLGAEASDMAGTEGIGVDAFGGLVDEFIDDIAFDCPELASVLRSDGLAGLLGPAVLAVSVSPFNPVPGLIAVARPADGALATAAQDAVVACDGADFTLQEGDVTMYVVADGGDQPLVLARVDGLFLAATDPELARAAIRLARGSTEPRFVDGAIGREALALMGEGLGLAIDLSALADALENLRGIVPMGGEVDPLVDRLLTSLRTVGGFAARITIDDAGILLDSALSVDRVAGDSVLAEVIACEACRAGQPRLIPSGVLSLHGRVVSPVLVVEWLDVWLAAIGDLVGDTFDVRTLALEFAGIDVDRALLDWIGTTWHVAQVGPLGTDLRGWVTGPGMITTVPVISEAAAREGIETWKGALDRLPGVVASAMGGSPLGAMAQDPSAAAASGMLSVRALEYRDVPYERWRIGPTVDVAVAVLDDHLVLASPAATMRSVIDVHHGATAVQDDLVLASGLADVVALATSYDLVDVGRALRAVASVADFVAAPAASALMLVIAEFDARGHDDDWGYDDEEWDWGWEGDGESAGLTGLWRSATRFGTDPRPRPDLALATLAVPGSVTAEISFDDMLSNGERGLIFELTGLRAGDIVQVEMLDAEPFAIDTFLYLYDLESGLVLADNDDAPGVDRSEILFEVDPTARYAVIASSYGGGDTGSVILNAVVSSPAEGDVAAEAEVETEAEVEEEASPEASDEPALAVPPVTFDEVVGLFDVVTAFFEELAARSGVAVGATIVEEGVTRSTLRIPLR